MMGWGMMRLLMGLGAAGLLCVLPGDATRSVHMMPGWTMTPLDHAGVVHVSEWEWHLSRFGMVQRLTQNLVQVFQVLDEELTPLYDGQHLVGFQLHNVERCPLFKEFGVRNGDIVRAVNGEPLQSLWEMYLRFRYVPHADVTIERQGHVVTLHYWIS